MKIRIIYIGILFLMPTYVFAQSVKTAQINQYNSKGQKEGYWIEDRGFDRIETYYCNGKKSGLFKSYTKDNIPTLKFFGAYHNDKVTGKWYYFDEWGRLLFTESNITPNRDTVTLYGERKYVYRNKSYTTDYYPSGQIKREGIVLWDDEGDIESGNFHEYGEWKYYDEDGNLIETKIFK